MTEERVNQQSLRKLNELLRERFWEEADQSQIVDDTEHDLMMHHWWADKCESLGIRRCERSRKKPESVFGQVFEESVVVNDPEPSGHWLEMSRETALKLLAIGLP
jgi:hypothetical protein